MEKKTLIQELNNNHFKEELEKTYKEFVKAINNKDFDKIATYYTDDCYFLWENGPKFFGNQNVIPTYKTMLNNLVDFKISVKEVIKLSDTRGIEFGEHEEIMDIDNHRQTFVGRYVIDWEQSKDSFWKIKKQYNLHIKSI